MQVMGLENVEKSILLACLVFLMNLSNHMKRLNIVLFKDWSMIYWLLVRLYMLELWVVQSMKMNRCKKVYKYG